MQRICRNCRLYNDKDSVCAVAVVIRGEQYELPVLATDECHWERVDREVQSELLGELSQNKGDPYFKAKYEAEIDSPIEVKQIRMWSDGKNGYVETPDGMGTPPIL